MFANCRTVIFLYNSYHIFMEMSEYKIHHCNQIIVFQMQICLGVLKSDDISGFSISVMIQTVY